MAGSQQLPEPRSLGLSKFSHRAEPWINQPGERRGSKVFFRQPEVSADVVVEGVGSLPPTPPHSPVLAPGHPCDAPVVLGVTAEGWGECLRWGLRQLRSGVP